MANRKSEHMTIFLYQSLHALFAMCLVQREDECFYLHENFEGGPFVL